MGQNVELIIAQEGLQQRNAVGGRKIVFNLYDFTICYAI
jgi:hypothetical protein